MTPEELGELAYKAWADVAGLDSIYKMDGWIASARAVAAAVKREDAWICREARDWNEDSGHDDGCIDSAMSIEATIPEGK